MKELIFKIKSHIKSLLTKRNQGMLFFVTIIFAVFSVCDVIYDIFPNAISIFIYFCAGLCFFSSLPLWILTVKIIIISILTSISNNNNFLSNYVKDYRLRTIINALPGLGFSLIYAIFNSIIGVKNNSAWHGSLATYYIILCVMRFSFALYAKNVYIDKKENIFIREMRIHKTCGIMLILTSIALMGAVIMLVTGEGGKNYPGFLIYAMAAYAFYKLPVSIINTVKAKKTSSPLLISIRNITNAEAMVAILSLQTALFAQFGSSSQSFVSIMNCFTGAIVCFSTFVLGIHMLFNSNKLKHQQ